MREKNGLNLLNAKVKVHSLRHLSGKRINRLRESKRRAIKGSVVVDDKKIDESKDSYGLSE